MHGGWVCAILFFFLAGLVPLSGSTITYNFDALFDGTLLTGQYSGATFTNAIILTTGITLDEFELPAHSGASVASDNGGPLAIVFATPLRAFSGYFTYAAPLTVQAFDGSNTAIGSAVSAYSNNQALSGASGSHPNEFLQITSAASIYKVVISGAAPGTSFAMDDVAAISRCDLDQNGMFDSSDVDALSANLLSAPTAADDMDRDGAANIVDLQVVVNAASGSGCKAI